MKTSFRSRILGLFIGLIATAQVATILAVLGATERDVLQLAERELEIGGRVFDRVLEAREAQLLSTVEVLARDFAFREAVATGDRLTIGSVLSNHGERVSADVMLLVSLDGEITAASPEVVSREPADLPFVDVLERARRDGAAASIVMYRDDLYQVVMVPVAAPLRIGWVCLGFRFDNELAAEFKALTTVDVSFWVRQAGGAPVLLASSRGPSESTPLWPGAAYPPAKSAALQSRGARSTLAGNDYLTLVRLLRDVDGTAVTALLQTSVTEALQGYRALRMQLVLLAAIALALSVLAAVIVARSVTRPVQTLVAAARRISAGNYLHRVEVSTEDEIGLLAATFNEMQEGIAKREAQIVYQASHDSLTGLYNRAVVNDRLETAIGRAQRLGSSFAVLMLDLDRFKEINDNLGHKVGDRVLQLTAERLAASTRQSDTLLRFGGDDFLLILENTGEEKAQAAARSFARLFDDAIEVDEMRIDVGVRIGVSVHPDHGTRPDMILRRADIALYNAKREHVEIAVYEPGQDEQHLRQLAIINELTPAIENDQFVLHYQPKIELKTREVTAVEALIRWNHPDQGAIRPDEFIPLAERSGHIRAITSFALETAIRQCRDWRERGINVVVAVNLSALDLSDDQLPGSVERCLQRYEVPASSLTLEVTETAVMENPAQAVSVLGQFRDCGIRLAIDDFGTGHSSLAQLKRIPVHELKIDKSFVVNLKGDSEDAVIVRSTIDLGHNMGLQIVAEGVEDAESCQLLQDYGCDTAQGYFFSRPLPPASFEKWVEAYYRDNPLLRVNEIRSGDGE